MMSDDSEARVKAYEKLLEREMDDLRFVLKQPQGRRLLWKLLCRCDVYKRIDPGDTESIVKRNFGVDLLNEIEMAKPETVYLMQREARSDRLLQEVGQ